MTPFSFDRDGDDDRNADFGAAGGGFGRDRAGRGGEEEVTLPASTATDEDYMPMTRRDVEDLYAKSLRGTKEFLSRREADDPTASLAGLALAGTEIAAGAAVGGFLAQRFRQTGAIVPVGMLIGAVGLAGAQFGMFGKLSPDVRNLSLGAIASGVALWAAGRGIGAAGGGTAATAGMQQPQPQQFGPPAIPFGQPPQFGAQPLQALMPLMQMAPMAPYGTTPLAPQPAYAPLVQGGGGPAQDLMSLVAARRGMGGGF